jgi:capsular polysaccharide transport system permease protein
MTGRFSIGLRVYLNALSALILRDVKSRAGPYYSGYALIFALPFAHLVIVSTIFSVTGRIPPVAGSPETFFFLSALPFVIFLYPSRQIAVAVTSNAALLSFPRIRLFDLIVARSALEYLNGLAVAAMILFVTYALFEFEPTHPLKLTFAILVTLYFGVAFGSIFALIARLSYAAQYATSLIYPLIWIGSGIVFLPSAIPSPYKEYLSYNPMLQCVELIRAAYYDYYPGIDADIAYVFWVSSFLLALAIIIVRYLQAIFLRG